MLVSGEPDAARQLIAEKEKVREVEARLQSRHIKRLRDSNAENLETSNSHQEVLRTLKQINTAFSMVAHPILNDSGDLLSSRLADPGAAE